MKIRIGNGYDLHATKKGDKIILGSVEITAPFSLKGHSDADILLHAITDALLGSIADNDIGSYFPPNKSENKGRASKDFLLFAHDKVKEQGYTISNIDCIIICERPKISDYRDEIRKRIAALLQIDIHQIGLKGKTSEKVGAIGREEAVACHAVVLVIKN